MRRSLFTAWAVALLVGMLPSQGAEESLLFRVPSEGSLNASVHGGKGEPLISDDVTVSEGPKGKPGMSLPVGGRLVYEGAGNAFIPAGTVSFWWRPDAKVQKTESTVLSISSLQRFYFSRWVYIVTKNGRLGMTLYHGDGADALDDKGAYPGAKKPSPKKKMRYELNSKIPLKPGEWYQITVTWDMGRGVAFYVNGELAGKIANPWFFGGNVNHISLAAGSSGYSKSGSATSAQSFADLQVFDTWLDEADVRRVIAGEPIQSTPDFDPLLKERAHRLGLDRNLTVPEAVMSSEATGALWLRQIALPEARDILRKSRSGLDGDLGRAWPLYQGYSHSGETLTITLPDEDPFNTLQVMGSGIMRFIAVDSGGKETPLLSLSSPTVEVEGAVLDPALKASSLRVDRDDGLLFNLGVFQAEQKPWPGDQSGWKFAPLQVVSAESAEEPLISQEFPPYDRTVLESSERSGEGMASLPAKRAIHLLGPATEKMAGLGAIAMDFSLDNPPKKTDVCLWVINPVTYEYRAVAVNFRAVSSDQGQRLRVVFDLRDLIYRPGQRPWVVLFFSEALQVNLAKSAMGFEWLDTKKATEEFVPDQLASVNDTFQEMSESRPWSHDPKVIKGLGSLLARIDLLKELAPEDPLVQGYWHWTHPKEPTPKVELPEIPSGVPPWAVYTERSIDLFSQAAHWWIDHRQAPNGEFGAPDGINDDTDIIQDWLAIDQMKGPDEKIRKSIEKVADISWHQTTTDGVSNQITDTLHIYEWGINAQTLAFVLNYGDPVYFERLLRFASHYPELMTTACDGKHLHFKSWYFGASRIVTEGIYGRDIQLNGLLLQPAMLLAWYNGDAASLDIVIRWAAGMRDHVTEQAGKTNRTPGLSVEIPSGKVLPEDFLRAGFPDAVWASYDLIGDQSSLEFLGQAIDYEVNRKPLNNLHTTKTILAPYLNASKDSRWDALWLKNASDPELWKHSLHNSNYKELESFYAAWLRTGDDKWLNEGTALALYHMKWSFPMLTEAEATTDRVWLPQRLTNEITLGGLSILRNELYPKNAVSWEHATGKFSPLVRQHSPESLEIELYNLSDKETEVDARIWSLVAGLYDVQFTAVSRTAPDEVLIDESKEQEISRYSKVPLKLPVDSRATLKLHLKDKRIDVRKRMDLAISPLDATYNPEIKEWTGTIHNIGSLPSGAFRVRALQDGKEIVSEKFESLPPPENFRTHKKSVVVPIQDPKALLTVEIISEEDALEITAFNNILKMVPEVSPPTGEKK